MGIIRISGPQARECAARVIKFPASSDWQPWTARLGALLDRNGALVDQAVVTFFAEPRSYTAEDVVEISCHGAPVILKYCLERLLAEGVRLAEPGEFTLRAYLHGRIDLPQAEAVRDLIEATTLYQARVAAQQSDGSLSRRISPWKQELVALIALLEAGIDFAEDDIPVASSDQILARLDPLRVSVDQLVRSYDYGKVVRSGFSLALVGRPNVGKSSLFNRLLEQDRAIVTEIPGTTRDTVSEAASLAGLPVRLVDTAGIREGQDAVEKLGIERTYRAIADADLTLVIVDASVPLSAADEEIHARAGRAGKTLLVGNKSDLMVAVDSGTKLLVSARTGAGVEALRERILELLLPQGTPVEDAGFLTDLRHQRLLQETAQALLAARMAVAAGLPHELLLLDLYAALRPIDVLTGATTAEDILGQIFAAFCIGK